MIQANCNSCGKIWQVPTTDRSYSCRDCGGRVSASVACPKCNTANQPDSAFCEACGQNLSAHETQSPAADPVDRRLANKQLAHLKKSIRAVRAYCILHAVLYGIVTVLLLLASLALPQAELILAFAFSLATFVASVLGSARINKEPFFWSLTIAGLATINLVSSVAAGDFSAALWLRVVVTGGLWVCVGRAGQAQKIMDQYPDLTLDRRRRSPDAVRSEAGQSRMKRSSKTRRREVLYLAGILTAVLTVALLIGLFVTAPPGTGAVAERFRAAWEANDRVKMGNLFEPTRRDRQMKKFEVMLRRRGWSTSPPALEVAAETTQESEAEIAWKVGSGKLVTRWRLTEEFGWQLRTVETKGFAIVGGPGDAIRAFKEAWARADQEALLGLYAAERAGRARRLLRRVFDRPEWSRNPPPITGEELTELEPGRFRVVFTTPTVPITCKFEYRNPVWRISAMRVPRVR